MTIKDVKHEEITPVVLRYMIKDIDTKLTQNHSDVLSKISRIETKLDVINSVRIEQAEMKKDIENNRNGLSNLWKSLGATAMVVFGGLIKFIFEIIKR